MCCQAIALMSWLLQADFPRLCLPDAMQDYFMMPSSVASAQQDHQSDVKQQQQATSTSSMGHTDEDIATLGPHEPPSNGCSHLPRSWSKAQAQPSHNWMQVSSCVSISAKLYMGPNIYLTNDHWLDSCCAAMCTTLRRANHKCIGSSLDTSKRHW